MSETRVKVVVRCRPLLGHEDGARDVATVEEAQGAIRINGKTHEYGERCAVGGCGRRGQGRCPSQAG